MRVLFEINHPAQVHFFKHLIWLLQRDGHSVLAAVRDKDVTIDLLDALGIEYHCISRKEEGRAGLAGELLERYVRLLSLARRFRPDAMMALTGVSIGLVGAILGVPRLVLEEAEHARMQQLLALPFATRIFTGTGYLKNLGPRQVRFRGIWVQAYLHPKYFQPNPEPLRQVGLDLRKRLIVLRTISWGAAHDAGRSGLREEEILRWAEELSEFGRVLITAEGPRSRLLEPYRNPVPVQFMHDLLAHASLYVGEGGTMAAEAAVLGTPAVYFSPLRNGYLQALDRDYGLIRLTDSRAQTLDLAKALLKDPGVKHAWEEKRRRLLEETDDIVEFMYCLLKQTISRARGIKTRPLHNGKS